MKKLILAFALLATLPCAAMAGERALNYDYLEAGYANQNSDADGAYLRGSVDFGRSGFYGFGEFARVEVNHSNFDVNLGEAGVGYHYGLNCHTDLLGELSYDRVDTDFGDADGYRASVGVRSALSQRFNGVAKVNYRDYQHTDGDYSLSLGGEFKVNPRWSVVGEVEAGEHDAEQYRLGLRANF